MTYGRQQEAAEWASSPRSDTGVRCWCCTTAHDHLQSHWLRPCDIWYGSCQRALVNEKAQLRLKVQFRTMASDAAGNKREISLNFGSDLLRRSNVAIAIASAIGSVATFVFAITPTVYASSAAAHGDVTPQSVDASKLKPLGKEWVDTNPHRGDEAAVEIGACGYNQSCARCHGLEAVSGGIAPDLRKLEADCGPLRDEKNWIACGVEVKAAIVGDMRFTVSPTPFPENPRTTWAVARAVNRGSGDLADALGNALATIRDDGQ